MKPWIVTERREITQQYEVWADTADDARSIFQTDDPGEAFVEDTDSTVTVHDGETEQSPVMIVTQGRWHARDYGGALIEIDRDDDPNGEHRDCINVWDYEHDRRDSEHPRTYDHIHALLVAHIDGAEMPRVRHTDDRGIVLLDADDPRATVCGDCGRAWDDTVGTAWTPVPAGRCPWEADHDDDDEALERQSLLSAWSERCIDLRFIFAGESMPDDETLMHCVRDQMSGALGDGDLRCTDVMNITPVPASVVEPTNTDRAERAIAIVNAYDRDNAYTDLTDHTLAEVAGDIIADLFHLADALGADPDEIIGRARMHHDAEVEEAAWEAERAAKVADSETWETCYRCGERIDPALTVHVRGGFSSATPSGRPMCVDCAEQIASA